MMRRILLTLVLAALFLSGCGAFPSDLTFFHTLVLSTMFLAACAESRERESPSDGGLDMTADAGGTYTECCDNGVVTSCFCPANNSCNYSWYCIEEDGSCSNGYGFTGPRGACDAGVIDLGPPDAGPPDLGGSYELCCIEGVVSSCYCPADAACNFALYCTWPDGTCTNGLGGSFGSACPVAMDAGVLDAS